MPEHWAALFVFNFAKFLGGQFLGGYLTGSKQAIPYIIKDRFLLATPVFL